MNNPAVTFNLGAGKQLRKEYRRDESERGVTIYCASCGKELRTFPTHNSANWNLSGIMAEHQCEQQ